MDEIATRLSDGSATTPSSFAVLLRFKLVSYGRKASTHKATEWNEFETIHIVCILRYVPMSSQE